jgi:hypothetical protein
MPLPKPTNGETKSAYMERCMGEPVMVSEFPDPEQRAAVCNQQFDREEIAHKLYSIWRG